MIGGDGPPTRFSGEADLARELSRARRAGLFGSLARIYREFPETTCENCARCCFESPGMFFVEYLHLVSLLAGMPTSPRSTLLNRAFGELFFSWIEPEHQCIFLESSCCTIYENRPLTCRLFGLMTPRGAESAEAHARLAARQDARRLRLFGIEIPGAAVRRSLVSCDRVRDGRGRPARIHADAIAGRVAKLDAALLPQYVVAQEFCFLSLPERLGAVVFGPDAVEVMRLQLLRRAQRGEAVPDLIAAAVRPAYLPSPLRAGETPPR